MQQERAALPGLEARTRPSATAWPAPGRRALSGRTQPRMWQSTRQQAIDGRTSDPPVFGCDSPPDSLSCSETEHERGEITPLSVGVAIRDATHELTGRSGRARRKTCNHIVR